jgi:prepilin-type N-terminal cleavage/methylation domain-containing protein
MNSTLKKITQTGFTLVELLIVVIILAILAAIVIPQFSSSTTDAQESALDANLAALRSAVELFKAQHNGVYPGGVAASGAGAIACSTGTGGTGAINTNQAWMDHLLMASDAAGHTCNVSDGVTYKFGPYLRKGIPNEPITGKGAAVGEIVSVATPTGAPLAADSGNPGGWKVDTKSGQIIMNSGANDSKTKAYSTH